MKALGLFFRIVLWLLVLSVGMVLLVIACSPESYRDLFVQTMVQRIFAVLTSPVYARIWPGLILILVALLSVLPFVCAPARTSVVAFATAEGPVEISLGAVKDFVNRLCKAVAGVREVSEVKVLQRTAGVDIRIRLNLGQGAHVPEITKRCQERVRQELGTSLGVEQIHQVAVLVDGVEPSTLAPSASEEPFRATAPFSEPGETTDAEEEFRP